MAKTVEVNTSKPTPYLTGLISFKTDNMKRKTE